MARAYHSWEQPPVYGWEQDDNLAPDEDSDSDPEDRGLHDAAFAADMFVDYILALFFGGKLSGKAVCVLCFWGNLAGARAEAINQCSLRPSSSSGHCQRKIDSVLGTTLDKSKYTLLKMPSHTKYEMSRTIAEIPVISTHEAVEQEQGQN